MGSRRRRALQRSDDSFPEMRVNSHETESGGRLNFMDAECLIRKFSGDGTINIKTWLHEFETYADSFKWNSVEKFIFCKRSLQGAAKLFVDCEAKPVSYDALKSALFEEFFPKFNSADVHKLLRERKKKDGESLREYLYIMIDLASQAAIDDASVISYVIDGIRDTALNKTVLYGAKSVQELKDKFVVYEKIKAERLKGSAEVNELVKKQDQVVKPNKRYCFNCGSMSHEAHTCPDRKNGPKCFGCNEFGHKRPDCPKNPPRAAYIVQSDIVQYPIMINGVTLKGLIDTGSEISMIKEHVVKLVDKKFTFSSKRTAVSGFGSSIITKGVIKATISLNDIEFEDVLLSTVGSSCMKPDVLIGMDVLSRAVVKIDGGKITLERKTRAPEVEDAMEDTEMKPSPNRKSSLERKQSRQAVKEKEEAEIEPTREENRPKIHQNEERAEVKMRKPVPRDKCSSPFLKPHERENLQQQITEKTVKSDNVISKPELLGKKAEGASKEEKQAAAKRKSQSSSENSSDSESEPEDRGRKNKAKIRQSSSNESSENNEAKTKVRKEDIVKRQEKSVEFKRKIIEYKNADMNEKLEVVGKCSKVNSSSESDEDDEVDKMNRKKLKRMMMATRGEESSKSDQPKKKRKKKIRKDSDIGSSSNSEADCKRTFGKKRKPARAYNVGDLVAIERVQYDVEFDRYEAIKVGDHNGPKVTTVSADKSKPWADEDEEIVEDNDTEEAVNDLFESNKSFRTAECGEREKHK